MSLLTIFYAESCGGDETGGRRRPLGKLLCTVRASGSCLASVRDCLVISRGAKVGRSGTPFATHCACGHCHSKILACWQVAIGRRQQCILQVRASLLLFFALPSPPCSSMIALQSCALHFSSYTLPLSTLSKQKLSTTEQGTRLIITTTQ